MVFINQRCVMNATATAGEVRWSRAAADIEASSWTRTNIFRMLT